MMCLMEVGEETSSPQTIDRCHTLQHNIRVPGDAICPDSEQNYGCEKPDILS